MPAAFPGRSQGLQQGVKVGEDVPTVPHPGGRSLAHQSWRGWGTEMTASAEGETEKEKLSPQKKGKEY